MSQNPATGNSGGSAECNRRGHAAGGNDGSELPRVRDSDHRVLLPSDRNCGHHLRGAGEWKTAGGDYAGAQAASNNAKIWCWVSFGIGLFGTLLWLLIFGAGMLRHLR